MLGGAIAYPLYWRAHNFISKYVRELFLVFPECYHCVYRFIPVHIPFSLYNTATHNPKIYPDRTYKKNVNVFLEAGWQGKKTSVYIFFSCSLRIHTYMYIISLRLHVL